MALKSSSIQLFLLLALITPYVITARHIRIRSSKSQFQFPKHLEGTQKGNNNDNIKGIQDVKDYLQRYGYLAKVENNNLNVFDDELESAIKTFQNFYNLNVSGTLDKDTLSLMSLPRCGVPDILIDNNNTTTSSTGDQMNNSSEFHSHFTVFPGNPLWPKYHLTYTFYDSFPVNLRNPVVNAMEQWAGVSKFTFSEASRWSLFPADIKFSFERGDHGDDYPFEGKGGTLAHSFGPMDARVHFDADENWVVGNVPDAYNVGMVALHELGHALGLGHSKIQEAVMWFSVLPGISKSLHFDDIQGIQTIYSR